MDFKAATDLLGVPLERVAHAIGREYSTVMAYRLGQREPTPEVWDRLADFMHEHGVQLINTAREMRRK